jgi:lipid II:glycine glycyltransferase (peptidoglycan interpeptide bridge formation enzyme)
MIFKRINEEMISEFLAGISLIAYSDAFAGFAKDAYFSRRSFIGVFEENELKAFFPIFERKYGGQKITELPLFIYTEIFFIDPDFKINYKELGGDLIKFLGSDVLRLNIYSLNKENDLSTNGLEHIFTAMITDLSRAANYEDYLEKVLSRNSRSKIYKSYGVGLEFNSLDEKDFEEFYNLYENHVRGMQSKPHPRGYFKKIMEAYILGKNLFMFGARYKGKLISANLFMTAGNYMEVRFLADDRDCRNLFPNNFLYSEMIKWAYDNGIRYVDFGGIPKKMISNIEFKKSFGAEECPIFTGYFFRNSLQKIIFRINRRILYLKKYPKLILNKFMFRK